MNDSSQNVTYSPALCFAIISDRTKIFFCFCIHVLGTLPVIVPRSSQFSAYNRSLYFFTFRGNLQSSILLACAFYLSLLRINIHRYPRTEIYSVCVCIFSGFDNTVPQLCDIFSVFIMIYLTGTGCVAPRRKSHHGS